MTRPPYYPKGDLRRMLAALGAIEAGYSTLVRIEAATGLDKKTITALLDQAGKQAGVSIGKTGASYLIEDWGPVLRKAGARMALTGALKAPNMSPENSSKGSINMSINVEIVRALTRLQNKLETAGKRNADWRLARTLEDRLGCGRGLAGDMPKAQTLLAKYEMIS